MLPQLWMLHVLFPRWCCVKHVPWTCCVGDPAQDCFRGGIVGIVQVTVCAVPSTGNSADGLFSHSLFFWNPLFTNVLLYGFFFFSCLFNNVKFSLQSSSSQLVLFSFLLELIEVSGVACRKKKSNLRLLFYTSKGYWKVFLACMHQQTCEQHFPIKTLKNFYWLLKVFTKQCCIAWIH